MTINDKARYLEQSKYIHDIHTSNRPSDHRIVSLLNKQLFRIVFHALSMSQNRYAKSLVIPNNFLFCQTQCLPSGESTNKVRSPPELLGHYLQQSALSVTRIHYDSYMITPVIIHVHLLYDVIIITMKSYVIIIIITSPYLLSTNNIY